MKRVLLVTAALVAAVAVFTPRRSPPRPIALDLSWSDGTIPGVLHIHTNRSDGLSTPDEIAAAAARAGLQVSRLHRSRRRDARARSAGVSIRGLVPRRRRDQHDGRTLRRDRHARVAVSARRRARATSSTTCAGSAGSASPRIPIRRKRSCGGATGTRRSTVSN